MAHPYEGSRAQTASRKRVGHIMKSGGATHSDEAADKKLIKKMLAAHEKTEHEVPGKAGKYARGGRTKSRKGKHGTQVNIAVVAPHGRHPADAGALPGGPSLPPPRPPLAGGPGAPPGLPPGGPPMGGPPGLPPGGPPGMMPPGMKPPGMMQRGGRVKMKGGAETGQGRLDKIKAYGKRARSK